MSNRWRPATTAPQFSVKGRSTEALASSTLSFTDSFALGMLTSPAAYHSNSSPGSSLGLAMKPSSDIVMWLSTLVIVGVLPGWHHHVQMRCVSVPLGA
jgi:hypothetical protein